MKRLNLMLLLLFLASATRTFAQIDATTFYGADLDPTCCKMAVYNMMLNSLTGEIAHMDSLSNEFFRNYTCRTKLVDGHYYPYFLESTDPLDSLIWLHPPGKPDPTPEPDKPFEPKPNPTTGTPVQGTLF